MSQRSRHSGAPKAKSPRTERRSAASESSNVTGEAVVEEIVVEDDPATGPVAAVLTKDEFLAKHFWTEGKQFHFCRICHPGDVFNRFAGSTGKGGAGIKGRFVYSTAPKTLRMHAEEHTEAIALARKNATNVQHSFSRVVTGITVPHQNWAIAIAMSGMAFSDVENAYIRAAIESNEPLPQNREQATTAVTKLKQSLQLELKHKLHGCMVMLALDGGTLNRQSLLNFAMIPIPTSNGMTPVPYFVESVRVASSTANSIAGEVEKIIKLTSEVYGVKVIGMVTDNASNMVRAARELGGYDDEAEDDLDDTATADDPNAIEAWLAEERPEPLVQVSPTVSTFFVHLRCWAHTLQLMIGDIAKQSQAAITAVKNLWCLPRATRNKLTAERMREGHTRTHLVRPAVTRWNSFTRAAITAIEFAGALASIDNPLGNATLVTNVSAAPLGGPG
jgi:hypothetical protein